jgi:hypothetical protein
VGCDGWVGFKFRRGVGYYWSGCVSKRFVIVRQRKDYLSFGLPSPITITQKGEFLFNRDVTNVVSNDTRTPHTRHNLKFCNPQATKLAQLGKGKQTKHSHHRHSFYILIHHSNFVIE